MLVSIIRFISDTVFPPSHDTLMVREAKASDLSLCVEQQTILGVETLLPFRVPLVRATIHEAKFHGNRKAFMLLGRTLHEYLVQLPQHEYIFIPIPLSSARKRERGFNQAAEIAKEAVTDLSHITLREDILKRTRHTKPQTDLPKEQREKNVKDAFMVTRPEAISDKYIILFDDVTTTGSTLNAAKASISRHNPASIICIALAH